MNQESSMRLGASVHMADFFFYFSCFQGMASILRRNEGGRGPITDPRQLRHPLLHRHEDQRDRQGLSHETTTSYLQDIRAVLSPCSPACAPSMTIKQLVRYQVNLLTCERQLWHSYKSQSRGTFSFLKHSLLLQRSVGGG